VGVVLIVEYCGGRSKWTRDTCGYLSLMSECKRKDGVGIPFACDLITNQMIRIYCKDRRIQSFDSLSDTLLSILL